MTPTKRTAIAGEVGPTHVRFAVVDRDELRLDHFVNFRCADFDSFEQALAAYLRSLPTHPEILTLAVAGTVENGHANVAGTGWRLIRRHLETAMSMRHVTLVRDISARALSLPWLEPQELEQVGGEAAFVDRAKTAVSSGHFLEAATLIPVRDEWVVLAGTAGEMSFGGVDERELTLMRHVAEGAPLTAARLLSNQALLRLYAYLLDEEAPASGEAVAEAFEEGLSKQDEAAVKAAEILSGWLGRYAGDLALMNGAEGGAYIFSDGGRHGLVPLSRQALRHGFDHGRSEGGATNVPLFLVDSTTAALKGAVFAIEFDEDHGAVQPAA